MDATTWAADLLIARAAAAADHTASTYGGTQRLGIHGRALLVDDVPRSLSVRDYPVDADDDWRADADAAYEAARERWAADGDDDQVRAAARSVVASQQADRWAERATPEELRRYRRMASGVAVGARS
jgi:hypothetical protein